jgi:dCTP deaminase
MSVFGREKITALMKAPLIKDRLIITPLMDENQIGPASIDVRLGNVFIVVRRGNLGSIDPATTEDQPQRYHASHYSNFGQKFFLHPHELVLASTLEYVRLPSHVAVSVTTRSSWGRVGLVIATATAVHPGWKGSITLELLNHGEVPLVLYPGLSVAQMVLYDAVGAPPYAGRFSAQTGPKPGRVSQNKDDLDFWTGPKFHS